MKTISRLIPVVVALLLPFVASAQVDLARLDVNSLPLVPREQAPAVGTYWLLESDRFCPPLPCPPGDFPDAPIYTLQNGQFLVDARNSERIVPVNASALESNVSMSPATGGDNANAQLYGPDVFHVDSLTQSNGFLVFQIQGLIPGDVILLAKKTSLTDDITNYWAPEWWFTAMNTKQVIRVPVPQDSPIGFYRLFDWTLYQAPSPKLSFPADGGRVTGTNVVVQGSLTDIYPVHSAQLLIDGNVVQTITNGPLRFAFDSTSFANSPHSLKIIVTSKIWSDPSTGYITPWPIDPTYFYPYDSSTASTGVTSSNLLAISSAPYATEADYGQATFGIDTSIPAVISLTITGPATKHISATNNTAGTISMAWDLTDDNNSSVPVPSTYMVTVSLSALNGNSFGPQPNEAGPAPSKPIPVSLIRSAHLGQLAVFRTLIDNTFLVNDNQQYLAQRACDSEWNASTITPNDPIDGFVRGPNPRNVLVFQSNKDYLNFWTYATNAYIGELEYVGHSRPEDGAFGSGDDAVNSTHLIEPGEVSDYLGNSYNASDGSFTFGIAKAFVRIEGCCSGASTSHMNWYFGIPDSPKPGLSPTAWLGWNVAYDYHGAWGLSDSPFEKHIADFQGWWNNTGFGNVSIRTAIANSFGSMGYPDYMQYRVVHGDPSLRWATY